MNRARVRVAILLLVLAPGVLAAAEIPVRFVEGSLHGYLVLRAPEGARLAQGDLIQLVRDGQVETRVTFDFGDGSKYDETAVFSQHRVFTLHRYRRVQRGPSFPEDTEVSMDRATGTFRVETTDRETARKTVLEGPLELPPDAYNGMVLTVVKNLPADASETVRVVAFLPKPRIVELHMEPTNADRVIVGNLEKTALHYVFKPRLGIWLKIFATVLGRVPPDQHAWLIGDDVPAFVRFEGPLYVEGPVWRIELTNPRWPE